MRNIVKKLFAIVLTLVMTVSCMPVGTTSVMAMYDSYKYEFDKSYYDEGFLVEYPSDITDEDAIQMLKDNYEESKVVHKEAFSYKYECNNFMNDFMNNFDTKVPENDRDYFIGFMKAVGIPNGGVAGATTWYYYLQNYEYNYYYDVTNAGKTREEVDAADYEAYWTPLEEAAEKERKDTIEKFYKGKYNEELTSSENANIKAVPYDVMATISKNKLTLSWKHKALYYARENSYSYFDIQIATKKDFSDAKTYSVHPWSVRKSESDERWGFKYTVSGLNKNKEYYIKISSRFDLENFWNNEIEGKDIEVYPSFVYSGPRLKDYYDPVREKLITTELRILGTSKPTTPIIGKAFTCKIKTKDGVYTLYNGGEADEGTVRVKDGNNNSSVITDSKTGYSITIQKAKVKKATKSSKKSKKIKVTLVDNIAGYWADAIKKYNKSLKNLNAKAGYQVKIYKTKKNAQKNKKAIAKKSSTKVKFTVKSKKLKNKKKLYVRARAYVKINGKKYYGKWSKVKKVKIK